MKYKTLFAFLLISTFASAGDVEKRALSYFDEIKISGNFKVELVHSDTFGIEIYDICCSMSEIKIDQTGSLLKINNDKGLINDNDFDIVIYYNKLDNIIVQRGAQLQCREDIKGNSLNIATYSGSNINLGVSLEYLDIMVSAGSSVRIDGNVDLLKANVNTGASLEMERTDSRKAEVKALTGGMMTCSVKDEIKAIAGTGGSIEYIGNPRITDIDTHLGGSISCNKRSVK